MEVPQSIELFRLSLYNFQYWWWRW